MRNLVTIAGRLLTICLRYVDIIAKQPMNTINATRQAGVMSDMSTLIIKNISICQIC